MYQSDMIRLAGGINVAAAIEDTYWAEIDYEQLLLWNPDYIVMASDADYTVDDVFEVSYYVVNSGVYIEKKSIIQFPDNNNVIFEGGRYFEYSYEYFDLKTEVDLDKLPEYTKEYLRNLFFR